MVETYFIIEKQDYKQKFKVYKVKVRKLKDLDKKNKEQWEEIIHFKEEKSCLHNKHFLTVDRKINKWKMNYLILPNQSYTVHKVEGHYLRVIYRKQVIFSF